MGREIKFRVWGVEKQKMFYIDENHNCMMQIGNGNWGVFDEVDLYKIATANNNFGDILMQYTGLKDKNGVEIYECDICRCIDCNDEKYQTTVTWNGGAFIIDVNGCDYDSTAIGWAIRSDIQDIEVIGNIYQNPKLLGGKA